MPVFYGVVSSAEFFDCSASVSDLPSVARNYDFESALGLASDFGGI